MSWFYQINRTLFFVAFVGDMFFAPLLILWPNKIAVFENFLWGVDTFWMTNIILKCITVRPDVDSFDTFEITSAYF